MGDAPFTIQKDKYILGILLRNECRLIVGISSRKKLKELIEVRPWNPTETLWIQNLDPYLN
jgi:hypothetical protein